MWGILRVPSSLVGDTFDQPVYLHSKFLLFLFSGFDFLREFCFNWLYCVNTRTFKLFFLKILANILSFEQYYTLQSYFQDKLNYINTKWAQQTLVLYYALKKVHIKSTYTHSSQRLLIFKIYFSQDNQLKECLPHAKGLLRTLVCSPIDRYRRNSTVRLIPLPRLYLCQST